MPLGLHQKRNKDIQEQVFDGSNHNSGHFVNVFNDLATNIQKKKLKPIKVEKKQTSRFFNNTDAQMMRKTYFQTLREQGESALEISQSLQTTS